MSPHLFDPAGGDLAALAALHGEAFDHPWTADAIGALLAIPGTFAFVLPDGFILARVAAEEAEILTLAVRPAARRKGLGRALVRAAAQAAAKDGAQSLFLEVATTNRAACALYQKQGFAPAGRRKAYYPGGQDALVLKAQLPLPPEGNFA
jgi:ribosomal-protein-alanine N-acetyltransferase